MAERVDSVIIGGGQAGLATSYYLTRQRREHVILEKRRIGEAWRSQRWDSFTLLTPNWMLRLPGLPYQGADPDGFLPRAEVVQYLERYADLFNPPVRTGVEVAAIDRTGDRFTVETNAGLFEASNVVVATGLFQKPKMPSFAAQLSSQYLQIHSSEYRNPHELPSGAVLVVGSGQSGCQIAEELYEHGRKVYLCTGSAGRIPRRYRGRDAFWWASAIGIFDKTVDQLSSPEDRFEANPQLSGKDGGRTLNLHKFALDGVTLLGRLVNARGSRVALAEDLMHNLTRCDMRDSGFREAVDKFIKKDAIHAPQPEEEPELRAGYDSEVITDLDLEWAGIRSIIWAAGYSFDFSLVRLPVCDDYGFPVQRRGVTAHPGLYFVGLPWLHKSKSGLFYGVGEDAANIAAHIEGRARRRVWASASDRDRAAIRAGKGAP